MDRLEDEQMDRQMDGLWMDRRTDSGLDIQLYTARKYFSCTL